MSLDYPICVENVGISILSDTSPAAVEYEGMLWVFYNGSGDDGIWFTRFDGTGWEHARCTRGVAMDRALLPKSGTSPCPVVFRNRLYLFWSSRNDDGILYSVWNGKRFRDIHDIGAISGHPIGLGSHTSPAAISFSDKLHVFWTGTANDALYFSTTSGGNVWQKAECCLDHVAGVGVAPGTSPALTVFKDELHVFYNGSGDDGTWYFKLSKSSSWSHIISIQQTVGGGNGFLSKTSPVALTMTDTDRMGLLWTGAGVNGVWYSLYNEGKWYQQRSVLKAISNHALHSNSNCSAVEFLNEPFIFWAGLEGGLWFTTRRIYDAARDYREVFIIILNESFDKLHVSLALGIPDLSREVQEQLSQLTGNGIVPADRGPPRARASTNEQQYTSQDRYESSRSMRAFITSMINTILSRDLIATSAHTFGSLVYLAIAKGYSIKMEVLLTNNSLKLEIIGPGKENGAYATTQRKDGGEL